MEKYGIAGACSGVFAGPFAFFNSFFPFSYISASSPPKIYHDKQGCLFFFVLGSTARGKLFVSQIMKKMKEKRKEQKPLSLFVSKRVPEMPLQRYPLCGLMSLP